MSDPIQSIQKLIRLADFELRRIVVVYAEVEFNIFSFIRWIPRSAIEDETPPALRRVVFQFHS